MITRTSEEKDIGEIMAIVAEAKQYFRENGIPQWQSEYPCADDIRKDIGHGGMVVE